MNKNTPYYLLSLAALMAAPAVSAYSTELGDSGITLDIANKLSFGAAWRIEERDPDLIGLANGGNAFSTNGDDSNLAFGRGLVAATGKLTSDFSFSWGESGAFVRASYLNDPVLRTQDYFNPANYGPGKIAPVSELEARTAAVRKHNGDDADILDAYVYTNFSIGDRPVTVKLGRQVINWGESTLITNGINSYLAADANQLRVPGFEVDEVLVPYEQLFISANLFGSLNFEGFYQLKWRPTEPDAAGSYFSTSDFVGIGGARANIGFGRAPENALAGTLCTDGTSCVSSGSTVPRTADRTPRDDGQFGIKLDYTMDALNSMNVGLYLVQYHSRLPLISGTGKTPAFASPAESATYFAEYPEEIKLYGLSFNTTLPFGGISVQGEYSLKQDQPLQIDDVELLLYGQGVPSQLSPALGAGIGQNIRGWRRHDVQQVDIAFTKIVSPSEFFRFDQLTILAEFAGMDADLPPTSVLRYEAPATFTPGDCTLSALACTGAVKQNTNSYATPSSWGYRLVARADYNSVLGSSIGLQPTLLFFHDVNGTSPTPLTSFIEDRKQLGVSLGWKYLENLSGDIGYMQFFGGATRNLIGDRDYVQTTLKYAF